MEYQKVKGVETQSEGFPQIKYEPKRYEMKTKHIVMYCMFIIGTILVFALQVYIEKIEKKVDMELKHESEKIINDGDKNKQELKTHQILHENPKISTLKFEEPYTKNQPFKQQPKPQPQKPKPTDQKPSIRSPPIEPKPQAPLANKPQSGVRAGISLEQKALWTKFFNLKNLSLQSQLAVQQKQHYETRYNISQYKQLPICIFIPSYNNAKDNRYIHNMNSVLQQDYSNYRIIFIDDASDDQTGLLVQEYARKHQISSEKLKIIINSQRKMAMPNIHTAAHHYCKPWQLFIIVDGDDQLVGKQVLKSFNAAFQRQDMWIIYSNFLSFRGTIGYSRQYSVAVREGNLYRKSPFMISHLRVFYTKLFTLIEEKDLKDSNGSWLRAANDVAMYLPMMEMSHKRISYFPQISYMYNSNTGLNNHKVKAKEQKSNERMIKTRNSYNALEKLFTEEELQNLKEDTDKKIPIKDLSLPLENQGENGEKVAVYGWEL